MKFGANSFSRSDRFDRGQSAPREGFGFSVDALSVAFGGLRFLQAKAKEHQRMQASF